MNILYALQGTGNGHLARAIDLYPKLKEYGQVDLLVSGIQGDIALPYPIRYQYYGMSFIFGQKGNVDYPQTFLKLRPLQLLHNIIKLPVHQYDLVISDFEPISAWACKWHRKTCFGLSHQSAVLHPQAPQAVAQDFLGKWILQHYAPTDHTLGFHFESIDHTVTTPIIRQQIRNSKVCNEGHYTVYLPAYNDKQLIKILSEFTGVQWQVFSKHSKNQYRDQNILINPINNEAFVQSFTSCAGIICGAGFETPAEAIYMSKKLIVIPMSGQYEQQCNAAFLKQMGITVIDQLCSKSVPDIAHWIDQDQSLHIQYPDNTHQVVRQLMELYWSKTVNNWAV